ncbi:hypothetical protein JRQ81_006306 [Phrynocephalus forsythii]|uniref:Uncharacterized protein n=1 Tax=Phrynocephalus forsythii TaxID=171643 RepID=A0A9Q1AUV4_9SAUR|nr:hypothetical protein JRQ81_006306 [Phrynocephalus forsythii]
MRGPLTRIPRGESSGPGRFLLLFRMVLPSGPPGWLSLRKPAPAQFLAGLLALGPRGSLAWTPAGRLRRHHTYSRVVFLAFTAGSFGMRKRNPLWSEYKKPAGV